MPPKSRLSNTALSSRPTLERRSRPTARTAGNTWLGNLFCYDNRQLAGDRGGWLRVALPQTSLAALLRSLAQALEAGSSAGAAQRVEHYEIAAYGTARTLADELDLSEAQELLDQTLDEEANADKLLTKIATGGMLKAGINKEAAR